MAGPSTWNIAMLGKTGTGKSSLANTIFGENTFTVNHGFNSETKTCVSKTNLVHDRSISLIDTPGFFDTDMPEDELRSEIIKCIIECAPEVHAFLIVLKWDRFTEQEQAVIKDICGYFSDDVLKRAVVVFTHGDQLPERMRVEQFVGENKLLSDLVKKCGGRCHIIDNRYWNSNRADEYRTNQFQVKELLNTIDKMVMEHRGRAYTNEMLQEVERKIKEKEEHIQQSSKNLSKEEIRNQAKKDFLDDFFKMVAGITTGMLLGALGGVAVMIAKVVLPLRKGAEKAGLGEGEKGTSGILLEARTAVAISAAVGAAVGGYCGYREADKADSVEEAVKNTALAVVQPLNQLFNSAEKIMEDSSLNKID